MIVIGLLLTGFGALFHIYAFVLESVQWTSARTRAVFKMTPEQAEYTRGLAFNQGFYNLFLAVGVVLGTILLVAGQRTVGASVVVTCALIMTGAGLVLIASDRRRLRVGMLQAVPPAVGAATLLIGLAQ